MNTGEKNRDDELKALVKKRDSHVNRLFYMMLELIFIFGLPAALAFWAGNSLDASFESGRVWLFSFLGLAFVLSWVIVIIRVRSVGKKLRE
jgi:uncharacterized membrane protein (DUF485 family)